MPATDCDHRVGRDEKWHVGLSAIPHNVPAHSPATHRTGNAGRNQPRHANLRRLWPDPLVRNFRPGERLHNRGSRRMKMARSFSFFSKVSGRTKYFASTSRTVSGAIKLTAGILLPLASASSGARNAQSITSNNSFTW